MKVLVTGGSGFIGSHVVDKLRNRGIEVRIFDMVVPKYRQDIEYYQGSLLDFDQVKMAMNGVDAVFHLAAVADVKEVFEQPRYSEAINVRGTANVLEAVRETKVHRLIYGSTIWVYSSTAAATVDETTPLNAPEHIYTAMKISGEYYCHSYSKLYNLDVTILRYGIPYGPRARDGGVVPNFVHKALRGEPLTISGDGLQFRQFVYVEDLAEGNVLALRSVARNRTYNLAGCEKITVCQIAETVAKIFGDVKITRVSERPGDFSGKEVDSTRAHEELGWVTRTRLEEGIRRYIQWYQERLDKRNIEWNQVDELFKKERTEWS